jgi:hypothetical protein
MLHFSGELFGQFTASLSNWAGLLEGMVVRASSCLRRAAAGHRSEIVRSDRFLANEKVTPAALLAGWGEQTAIAAADRHVLAIQSLPSRRRGTPARSIFERRRGLGEARPRLHAS